VFCRREIEMMNHGHFLYMDAWMREAQEGNKIGGEHR
jgi:hypothetical protein